MEKIKVKPTLKGAVFVDAMQCGLLSADENGNIDISTFESFWCLLEKRLQQFKYCKRKKALTVQTSLCCVALLFSILSLIIKLITK